ncbi:MAG: type IV pilus modification PilV family protein [Bacillota bacterium]
MHNSTLESGFSLIELSFSIAIFAIVMLISSSFFLNNIDSSSEPLHYQALSLARSTLEEYKAQPLDDLNSKSEDYGAVKNVDYDSDKFKRKITVRGDKLKEIKVTVFWRNKFNQEKQISLSTMRSTEPFASKKEASNHNQALKQLLTAKADLAQYKEQNNNFPAWDKRSGDLKQLADYYSKFTTRLANSEQFCYRNPRFYEWWEDGYLLIYREPLADQYYCITNKSGIFTIPVKERTPEQVLGDMFANSNRDKLVFITNATKFKEGAQNDEK